MALGGKRGKGGLSLFGATIRDPEMNDKERFIRDNTEVSALPMCPEISLHLASEITGLWEATEAELEEHGLPPPYWAFCWPGSQGLARHLLDNPDVVRDRRVLDFASGSGAAAIAAGLARAAAVTACEIDAFSATAISLNASLNGVDIEVWLEDIVGRRIDADPEMRWDVVLAGDVCYERAMAERVMAWMRELAGQGVQVLVGDPGRAYLQSEGLEEIGRFEVPTSFALEDRLNRDTRIYRIKG